MGTKEAPPLSIVINNALQEFAADCHPTIPQYRLSAHPLLKKTLKKWQRCTKKVEFSEKIDDIKHTFPSLVNETKSSIEPKAAQNSESEIGRKKSGKLQFF